MGRMEEKRTPSFILGGIFVVAGVFFLFGSLFFYGIALRPASRDPLEVDRFVHIPQGMSARRIAKLLAEEGIVVDGEMFSLLLRMTKTDRSLQAGYYRLNPTMSAFSVIEALSKGITPSVSVTFPEGYTLKQIADTLTALGLVDRERFLFLTQHSAQVFPDTPPFLLPSSLEGYLFPDTYRFVLGQKEESIIQQMVLRFFDVVVKRMDEDLKKSSLSLHEIITLASIVEKESAVDRERPYIAAVFLNRLQINMRLQSCATVLFLVEEDRNQVFYRDLEMDSPYNTYRHLGLPPGPIASPGVRSILAVLHPAPVEYLFFVSRQDGTHTFTYTFEDHVQARRQLER